MFVNFRHIVRPPYRESTVLTVSVPGSVADTHRRTESGTESLTSLKLNTTESNTNLQKILTKRLAGRNLLHCGSTAQNTQNHRQKLGRRRNPIYTSSSTSKSSSTSSAEKHGTGGVSTLRTQQVPSFRQDVYLDAWDKARKGSVLVLQKSRFLMHVCISTKFFFEERRYERGVYVYVYV